VRSANATATTADVLAALALRAPVFRFGDALALSISGHAYNTKLVDWKVGSTRTPLAVTLCVPLGNTRPRRAC
jgi:hypothetical protein